MVALVGNVAIANETWGTATSARDISGTHGTNRMVLGIGLMSLWHASTLNRNTQLGVEVGPATIVGKTAGRQRHFPLRRTLIQSIRVMWAKNCSMTMLRRFWLGALTAPIAPSLS